MASFADDFSQDISEELACPFCLKELKEPKMLDCSHNVCQECLEWMSKRMSFKKSRNVACPICKKLTKIPKEGVRGLRTNRTIAQVVKLTLARKARIEIPKSLTIGKPIVELLATTISELDKPLRVLEEIHEKTEELVNVIRYQEQKFYREVEKFYGREREEMRKYKYDLDELHSSALKSVQEAETILQQTKPESTKIINVEKQLKQQIEKITQLGLNLEGTLLQELEFKINAHALIESIPEQRFGKLTKKPSLTSTRDQESHGNECATSSTQKSQERAAVTSKPDAKKKSLQGTSKATRTMPERCIKESCVVCNGKATHYCQSCEKWACKTCLTIVTRLRDGCRNHHLVEGNSTTRDKKVC